MTDSMTLNIICAFIVGVPMFYVAWCIWNLRIKDEK